MKKHIVCIDDDPQVLTTLRLVLEHDGFQVTMAPGGRQGLEAIRQLKPDLVVLDLMMPEMDGWEVFQQVKTDDALKHIPFVIFTAKGGSIDRTIGLKIAKVEAYLTKPLSPQVLVQTIRKVLEAKADKAAGSGQRPG
jgi:two-component system, OmpR family, response regulator VicR